MRLRTAILTLTMLAPLASPAASSASWTFKVSSTSVVNGDAPHGLWTNKDFPNNYFDINEGTFFKMFNNGTATLTGSATNSQGHVAIIDLAMSCFLDDLDPTKHLYKQEGGLPYPGNPLNPMDFYEKIVGTISFPTLNKVVHIDRTPEIGGRIFTVQVGLGANAKSRTEFGASAWIQSSDSIPTINRMTSSHWDLNLKLEHAPEAHDHCQLVNDQHLGDSVGTSVSE